MLRKIQDFNHLLLGFVFACQFPPYMLVYYDHKVATVDEKNQAVTSGTKL